MEIRTGIDLKRRKPPLGLYLRGEIAETKLVARADLAFLERSLKSPRVGQNHSRVKREKHKF